MNTNPPASTPRDALHAPEDAAVGGCARFPRRSRAPRRLILNTRSAGARVNATAGIVKDAYYASFVVSTNSTSLWKAGGYVVAQGGRRRGDDDDGYDPADDARRSYDEAIKELRRQGVISGQFPPRNDEEREWLRDA